MMDPSLNRLVALIEHTAFDSSSDVFPFDALFGQLPPPLTEAFLLHAAAAPRIPRRLQWEAATVSAWQSVGRFDDEYLTRAEALPSIVTEGYVVHRVIAHALRGRARMEYLRASRWSERDRGALVRGAREDLDLAVAEIAQHGLPRTQLFAALVSAGNAWRMPPNANAAEAIARYQRATQLGTRNPEERARLAKCHADGLVARGEPGDFDRAIALLQESLQVRRNGPLESATLIALAEAERSKRREQSVADCEHVHRILLAAQRSDRGVNAGAIAAMHMEILGAWLRHAPGAQVPLGALDEIVDRVPALRERVEFARVGGIFEPRSLIASVKRLMHPALLACQDVLRRIEEQTPLGRETPIEMLQNLPPGKVEEIESHIRRLFIGSDPDQMVTLAERLRVAPTDEATPGRLVARARTLARLALFGRTARHAVETAARDAEQSLGAVEEPAVRALLLLELASTWAPKDLAHPIKDFAEGARLCEVAVDAAKSDEHLQLDALLRLARSNHHRVDGDLLGHRERAMELYADIIRRAPALGDSAALSSAQQNLAALATTGGTGTLADRTAEAQERGDAADRLGNPMAMANRAWDLTTLSCREEGARGAELLRQALALFAKVPMDRLSESERLNVRQNRTVAETHALQVDGRLAEAAQRWRDWLEEPEVQRRPDLVARGRHNLGDLLVRRPDTVEEGIRSLESALRDRPLDQAPREHWETSLSIAMALGPMLAGVRPWTVRMSRRDGRRRAIVAARSAVKAGRRLGLGEELAHAGRHVCQLALISESHDDFESLMEEGWRAISDSLPCMLGDTEAERNETDLAELAAIRVFRSRCERSATDLAVGQAGVLRGEAANAVLGWMERAMLPQQRRLAARFAKPTWCDAERWRSWGALLDEQRPLAISGWVEAARREHPDFLEPSGDPGDTEKWLQASPTRAVIALLPTRDGVLAALQNVEDGIQVILRPRPTLPVSPADLPGVLAKLFGSTEAASRIEQATTVARVELIEPLLALATTAVSYARIAVGADLRWLPPSALLPDAVLHVAPSIRTPRPAATAPGTVTKRVVLIAADPHEDLGNGIAEVGRLSNEFATAARVTTALGKGARWGRSLGVAADGLVDRSPSPDALFELAEAADIVVVLAHGRVIESDGPAIELMDASGKVAPLSARSIASRPTAFAGRHIVLLSCEAGFVEATPHRLGLLLGELLACGAASVTAASWAVPLESALTVGRFVVNALLNGREPEEGLKAAIAQLLVDGAEGGAPLGRRVDAADRRATRFAAARAWVTWRP